MNKCKKQRENPAARSSVQGKKRTRQEGKGGGHLGKKEEGREVGTVQKNHANPILNTDGKKKAQNDLNKDPPLRK